MLYTTHCVVEAVWYRPLKVDVNISPCMGERATRFSVLLGFTCNPKYVAYVGKVYAYVYTPSGKHILLTGYCL